jgi:hypothetical protein
MGVFIIFYRDSRILQEHEKNITAFFKPKFMKGWIKSRLYLCGLNGNKPDLTRLPTNKLLKCYQI